MNERYASYSHKPVSVGPSALAVSGEKADWAAAAHQSSAWRSRHGDANVHGLVAPKKKNRQMLKHLLAPASSFCALEHLA